MTARTWIVGLPVAALAVVALVFWNTQRASSAEASSSAAEELMRAQSRPPVARKFYGRRLEPRDPVVLHGAGQSDEISFANYSRAVAPSKPMLTLSYVDLRDDVPAYFARLRTELARYSDLLVPQIGLSLNADSAAKHYEAQTAAGADDARLQQLCAGMKSLDRPVFLRIGYEFNGPWNGYNAAAYVAAFRHVVETVRKSGLENVAVVWDWSAGAELDAESGGADPKDAAVRYMSFYPGDDWVDWWGFNVFGAANLWRSATQSFLADAEQHRMPVMIGESTPKGHSVSEGPRVLDAWYKPYFGLIHASAGIKAFCYIDWDWAAYPQWSDWGNARIEDNESVLAFYRDEVSRPFYAGAQPREGTLAQLRAH